ncbi:nitroreductase family protein [Arthrobacter sp. NPDC090010]|uniref:nitroreductase family protein n=1 Tax=Arthrobacter sp. NPDC090010 TaxID=3363942 RepID=UPI0038279D2E
MTKATQIMREGVSPEEILFLGVPDSWSKYDWHRPYLEFLRASKDPDADKLGLFGHPEAAVSIISGYDLGRALRRRSHVAWQRNELPVTAMRELIAQIYRIQGSSPSVFVGIRTQNVQGWSDGWWLVDNSPRQLLFFADSEVRSSSMVQGQLWADGDGLGIFLGVDWEYHASCRPDSTSSYFQELVDAGRYAQTLTLLASNLGLGTRMTPALSEARVASVLGLPPERDVLHFVRVGVPAVNPNQAI